MSDKKFICHTAELAENSYRIFPGPGGKEGILLNRGGKLSAFVNSCSHMGGPTALEPCGDGVCRLRCQWHGATFDAESGQALTPPAPRGSALRELRVIIEDNKIYYE